MLPRALTSSFFVNELFNKSYENHQDSFIRVFNNYSTKTTNTRPSSPYHFYYQQQRPIEPSILPNVYRSDPHCAVQRTADSSSSPRRTDSSFYAAPSPHPLALCHTKEYYLDSQHTFFPVIARPFAVFVSTCSFVFTPSLITNPSSLRQTSFSVPVTCHSRTTPQGSVS